MSKIKNIFIKVVIVQIAVITLLLTACNKLKERSLTTVQKSDYFKTVEQFQFQVNGLYAQLFDDKVWHGGAYVTMTFDDDDTQGGNSDRPGQDGTYDMIVRTADAWKGFNSLIQKCNVVLDAVAKDSNAVLSPAKANQFKGEALFLRGHSFFEMGRRFGPIPLRTAPYIEGVSNPNIGRDSLEKVYLQAASDMQTAANLLPTSYTIGYSNADRGRPTKQAALGTMAKIYLHLAGAEVYGASGSAANPAKVQECFSKAAAAAMQVRDLAASAGFPILEPNYSTPFKYQTQQTCNEILFQVQSLTNVSGKGIELAFTLCPPASGLSGTNGTGGGGQVTLRWDFVGTKFWGNDRRISWDTMIASKYYYNVPGKGEQRYIYDPRNVPFGAGTTGPATNANLPVGSKYTSSYAKPNVGVYSGANDGNYGWNNTISFTMPDGVTKIKGDPKLYCLKYQDPNAQGNISNGCCLNILRYADVLLMLAEAENEVNGPDADAIAAINQVRTRAGIGTIVTGISQSDFRDSVRLERRRELFMEYNRKWDLKRWGTFVQTMTAAKRPRQDYQNLYPIPIEELSANSAIKVNNPGY